jgi:hypothetical protein
MQTIQVENTKQLPKARLLCVQNRDGDKAALKELAQVAANRGIEIGQTVYRWATYYYAVVLGRAA